MYAICVVLSVLTLFVDIKGYKKDAYYQIDCASRNFQFLILLIGYALLRASEIRLYDPSLTPALYAYIDRLQYVSIKKKNTVLIANCTVNAAMSFFEESIVIFAQTWVVQQTAQRMVTEWVCLLRVLSTIINPRYFYRFRDTIK